jgi:hypothetical protein
LNELVDLKITSVCFDVIDKVDKIYILNMEVLPHGDNSNNEQKPILALKRLAISKFSKMPEADKQKLEQQLNPDQRPYLTEAHKANSEGAMKTISEQKYH